MQDGAAGLDAEDHVRTVLDSIGERLRELRQARGIGVRELARRVDITPSMLSQLERGTTKPSVGTLFRLAAALETTTDSFFESGDDRTPQRGPVVRQQQRSCLQLSDGIVWERLTPTDEHDFEFMETVYPPGAASSAELLRHPGRDYGVLLEGVLDVTVGFAKYRLRPGDSIAFDASVPHQLSNPGPDVARTIWVVLDRHTLPS
jgi:transcriptional regulator with XRE-family HTH domain